MTPEELMKPRYKVIADYPDNKDFPVGNIIEFHPWESHAAYWEHTVEDCQGKRSWLDVHFDNYPHLFKKISWWEERSILDQPKYVKRKATGIVYEKKIEDGVMTYRSPNGGLLIAGLWSCEPATESEYNEYLNQKTPQ